MSVAGLFDEIRMQRGLEDMRGLYDLLNRHIGHGKLDGSAALNLAYSLDSEADCFAVIYVLLYLYELGGEYADTSLRLSRRLAGKATQQQIATDIPTVAKFISALCTSIKAGFGAGSGHGNSDLIALLGTVLSLSTLIAASSTCYYSVYASTLEAASEIGNPHAGLQLLDVLEDLVPGLAFAPGQLTGEEFVHQITTFFCNAGHICSQLEAFDRSLAYYRLCLLIRPHFVPNSMITQIITAAKRLILLYLITGYRSDGIEWMDSALGTPSNELAWYTALYLKAVELGQAIHDASRFAAVDADFKKLALRCQPMFEADHLLELAESAIESVPRRIFSSLCSSYSTMTFSDIQARLNLPSTDAAERLLMTQLDAGFKIDRSTGVITFEDPSPPECKDSLLSTMLEYCGRFAKLARKIRELDAERSNSKSYKMASVGNRVFGVPQ